MTKKEKEKEKEIKKQLDAYGICIRRKSKGIIFRGRLLSEDEIPNIPGEAIGLLEELGGVKERKSPQGEEVYIFLR